MGVVNGISLEEFPKQMDWVGKRCNVIFNYDSSSKIMGTVVRCDAEAPGVMIIRLDDGRYVLSTECQYDHPK